MPSTLMPPALTQPDPPPALAQPEPASDPSPYEMPLPFHDQYLIATAVWGILVFPLAGLDWLTDHRLVSADARPGIVCGMAAVYAGLLYQIEAATAAHHRSAHRRACRRGRGLPEPPFYRAHWADKYVHLLVFLTYHWILLVEYARRAA